MIKKRMEFRWKSIISDDDDDELLRTTKGIVKNCEEHILAATMMDGEQLSNSDFFKMHLNLCVVSFNAKNIPENF